MGASHPKKPAAVTRAAEMVIQRLEERRMLSVYLEDDIWYIEIDDNKNHVITIDINPKNQNKIRAIIDDKVAGTVDFDDIDWVELYGGGGDELITNLAGPDITLFAYAGKGNDTIIGGSGYDELSGEEGNDSISGGGGDDYLWGDEGQDTINGGKGDDEIYGDVGSDKIDGGGGDDTIYAGGGNDDIDGSGGDDDIWGGNGDDDIEGDGGEDDIWGGWGDDDLDGGDGSDDLSGNGGDDELIGAAGDDDMEGMDGRDTLAGGLGDDDLSGGRGADQEHGGYGDDDIYGNFGRDTIWGGDGSDLLVGGRDRDLVYSESGDKVQWGRWDRSRNDELVNPLHKVEDQTELKNWLIDQAVKQYSYLLGRSSFGGWYGVGEPDFDYPIDWGWGWWGYGCYCRLLTANDVETATAFTADAVQAGTLNNSISHSDTNTQEQGVDEADLVETDGAYLYSIIDGQLQIISALPADETHLVSTTDIDGYVTGIYLDGDRLVVLSQVYHNRGANIAWNWYSSYRSQTKVTVLDVSDRTNPTVAEESVLDGWLTSSRQIDGRLYLVMNNNINLPMPRLLKVGDPQPDQQLDPVDEEDEIEEPIQLYWRQEYRYETEQEYRERLLGMSLEDLLPQYSTKIRGADGQMIETSGSLAGQIYVPDDQSHYTWNMSSLVLINLNDAQPGPTAVTNIIGMDGQIYASARNLYVTTSVWERPIGEWSGEQRTDIYKFSLGENSVDLQATGEVPGWTLNSFSMDEEGDYFRLATNTHEGNSSNNLFVLKEDGQKLDIVGGVTGLAFSERIYAARFVGDKAYLVTFPLPVLRWGGPAPQDPLFTIDLSDPTQPTVMGELVIPGYSTYLHPLDDGHLLAIGRDGNDVQVSLFDVSDMSAPRRVDVYTIENGWYSWSQAENDHHAFAYFPEHHLLALPTETYDDGYHPATLLLSVDDEKGLEKVGQIEGDSRGGDQRNVRIGDFIYAFFGQELKVVSIGAPDAVVADVQLPPPPLRPLEAQVMMIE